MDTESKKEHWYQRTYTYALLYFLVTLDPKKLIEAQKNVNRGFIYLITLGKVKLK